LTKSNLRNTRVTQFKVKILGGWVGGGGGYVVRRGAFLPGFFAELKNEGAAEASGRKGAGYWVKKLILNLESKKRIPNYRGLAQLAN
jgi:hypothetical protein